MICDNFLLTMKQGYNALGNVRLSVPPSALWQLKVKQFGQDSAHIRIDEQRLQSALSHALLKLRRLYNYSPLGKGLQVNWLKIDMDNIAGVANNFVQSSMSNQCNPNFFEIVCNKS